MYLLDNPRLAGKWMPRFLCGPFCWKIFSGKWEISPSQNVVCVGETDLFTGESIALIGSSKWADSTFNVTFTMLTDSFKPPDGGVIIYSRFKNFKNYYSYHFCIFKNTIELIKRSKGQWRTIFEQDYIFEVDKQYQISITSDNDRHQCRINGNQYIEIEDADTGEGFMGLGTKYCSAAFNSMSIVT